MGHGIPVLKTRRYAKKIRSFFERETETSDLVKYYYFVIIVIIIVNIHYKIKIKIKFRFRGLFWELFVKLKMFSNRFLYMVFGCKCPNTIFSPKPRGKATARPATNIANINTEYEV